MASRLTERHGRPLGMKVKLIEAPDDLGLRFRREMWVHVVSDGPLFENDWPQVVRQIEPAALRYLRDEFDMSSPEFQYDTWEDDDPDRDGFEHWWLFTAKPDGGK